MKCLSMKDGAILYLHWSDLVFVKTPIKLKTEESVSEKKKYINKNDIFIFYVKFENSDDLGNNDDDYAVLTKWDPRIKQWILQ